jgi:hypothetical protein
MTNPNCCDPSRPDEAAAAHGLKYSIGVAAMAVHFTGVISDAEQNEALVQTLIDLLKQTGDLTELQAGEAWYEEQSKEHDVVDLFHSGGCTRVSLDGSVEQFRGIL